MPEDSSKHFRTFATSLERELKKYSDMTPKELEALQKLQVEGLVALERQWRAAVVKHRYGCRVYEAFVDHIVQERRNILAARPYFRERQPVFMQGVAPAIRKRAWRQLAKYDVNWSFISFCMKAAQWHARSPVTLLANQIKELRQQLVLANTPLAISRARIFWSRTQKSHLSFMELVNIAVDGLHSAVDKYCLPYSKVFCSVIIGRVVGNCIEAYSETMLHFYPSDRRKIYRAHKIMRGKADIDPKVLEEVVNHDVPQSQLATAEEIQALVIAASTVSTDSKPPSQSDDAEPKNDAISGRAAPDDTRPDVRFEAAEAVSKMLQAAKKLPLLEKKFLRLKGIPVSLD